ncbi:MAG TPA: SLC13 family permease [Gammaproteobacteria bacterium]|nr:SLC13 family permease [Gammaproteobacteria bacterium]
MAAVVAAGAVLNGAAGPVLLGVRAEFLLFGLTLLGVALLHHRTFEVAVAGLVSILVLKLLAAPGFDAAAHFAREAPTLLNLLGLLLGFAVLARYFEQSQTPEILPRYLPDDWKGGFVLLVMVFVLSSFLDNIAAALIGGTVALHVYRKRVDVGFCAAIVAASNAGGSGSVVGDTTTTMMWIEGVQAADVLHGYVAAVPALLFLAFFAARGQQRYEPIQRDEAGRHRIDVRYIAAVVLILGGAIAANVLLEFPAAGVWAAIVVSSSFARTDWRVVPASLKGTLFLLALVSCASLMPVEELPAASWHTAFGLGWVSAVFDNIPLTKLALEQGHYDWGMLAYTVGFGGSMVWFGSSAGVALGNLVPEAKSVGAWIRRGWFVIAAYVLGFFVLLAVHGWAPLPIRS